MAMVGAEQSRYPIGVAGMAWGAADIEAWRNRQRRQRSHSDIVARIQALHARFAVEQYGELSSAEQSYPLLAVCNRWHPGRPTALVTGGVHGYETSGVLGALEFLEQAADGWADRFNLCVVPCVSPWAFERIQRWNEQAVDPNRSFRVGGKAWESLALMQWLAPRLQNLVLHVDLHETTDSDESEFRPALAARDGKDFEPGVIPDGFYLVADRDRPELPFQESIIDAVSRVTHIAPADAKGEIIGSPLLSPGIIAYPFQELGLCAGLSSARFRTTTEVYPDSPKATPERCNQAQVAAVLAALQFVSGQLGV